MNDPIRLIVNQINCKPSFFKSVIDFNKIHLITDKSNLKAKINIFFSESGCPVAKRNRALASGNRNVSKPGDSPKPQPNPSLDATQEPGYNLKPNNENNLSSEAGGESSEIF